ncbi:MAG: transposase [Polyangiales bacterium]
MNRSRCRLVVHCSWSTFDRLPIITAKLDGELRDAVAAQCDRLAAPLIAFGASTDHVHVLFVLPSTVTASTAIGAFKGASGYVLQPRSECLVAWSRGYFAQSAWPDDLDELTQYVRHQREVHETRRVLDRFEAQDPRSR